MSRGRTPPFRAADGTVLPGSIAEAGYRLLGGVKQWVMIRGESLDNPALIVLHGGPGFTDTPFFRSCNAELERSFTVVYWDQRGAGKSFARDIPRSSMTVDQFLADLDELTEGVCAHLGRSSVVILGHSWGTVLGVLYATRSPGRIAAYVGCAQIGNWPEAEAASYRIAVQEAERQNHPRALKVLRAIGPPPYSASAVMKERTWLQRLDGQLRPKALWGMRSFAFGVPEYSLFDLPRIIRGFRFSLGAMWDEVSALNLLELAPALAMPVFLFQGRRDRWVPPETSRAYFDVLTAPSKEFVWFEESAHEPFVDEPERFNRTMLDRVRPVALSPES